MCNDQSFSSDTQLVDFSGILALRNIPYYDYDGIVTSLQPMKICTNNLDSDQTCISKSFYYSLNSDYHSFLRKVKNNDFSKYIYKDTFFEYKFKDEACSSASAEYLYSCAHTGTILSQHTRSRLSGSSTIFNYTQGYFDLNPQHSFEINMHGLLDESTILNLILKYVQEADDAWICGYNKDTFRFAVGEDLIDISLKASLHANPIARINKKTYIGYQYPGYSSMRDSCSTLW